MECPRCGSGLSNSAKYCGCGWSKTKTSQSGDGVKHHDGQCEWRANGRRCNYAGTFSTNTRGGGPWYCMAHSGCSDPAFGAQVVEQSRRDVPHPDYSYEARKRMAERAMEARNQARAPFHGCGPRAWCAPENIRNQHQVEAMLRNPRTMANEIKAAEEAGVIVDGRFVRPDERMVKAA